MRTRRIRRKFALVGVYAIINRTNGRAYIGSSTNLLSRLSMHERALIAGTHPNAEMQRDFNDTCRFEFDILHVRRTDRQAERTKIQRSERMELYALEWQYIKQYEAIEKGYNQQAISHAIQKDTSE